MTQRTVSPLGAWGCFIAAAAAILCAKLFFAPEMLRDNFGTCLPSPNLWPLTDWGSWGINTALLLISCVLISYINKKYSLIKGTEHILTPLFLIFCAGNPFMTWRLTSAMLLLPVALVTVAILFDSYKSRNSTQQVFIIATFLSIGSMLQYAFLALTAATLLCAAVMICLHFREVMAFLLGLIAPYWIAIGMGLVPLDSFRAPEFNLIFNNHGDTVTALMLVVGLAVSFIISGLLCLNNMVRLYAGNSRIRSENNVINILGVMAALCIAVDFNNMTAYFGIFYLWSAVQLANLFVLWHIRRSWIIFTLTVTGCLCYSAAMMAF